MKKGTLIISLDFEMMWGNIEKWELKKYGHTNIAHVPEVINRLLDLFSNYDIHATFAIVGLLMHRNKEEAIEGRPFLVPSYRRIKCSPYNNNYIGTIHKSNESLYFAPNLVERIKNTQGMEIGTHTYSHYYCWEKGQTVAEFDADIHKAIMLGLENGLTIRSIIFPRNNVSKEHLNVCSKYQIETYRGNAVKYFKQSKGVFLTIKQRVCRFLDTYINLGGNSSIPYERIDMNEKPINLAASRFIRPYDTRLKVLESLRLHRIKTEMKNAAQMGEMYHIWWHPHNFGANIEQNFSFLEEILKCYKECRDKYGMLSLTMSEMKDFLETNN